MSRRQDQNEFRIFGEKPRPRLDKLGLFTFERAASDNEPQVGGNRPQVARGIRFLRRTHVEFEIAGDRNAIWKAAEREQAVGVGLALHKHARETSEPRTPKPAHPA